MTLPVPSDEERVRNCQIIMENEGATEREIIALLDKASKSLDQLKKNSPEARNLLRKEKVDALEKEKQYEIETAKKNAIIFDVCNKFLKKVEKKSFNSAKVEMIKDETIDLKKVGGSVAVLFFLKNTTFASKSYFEKIKHEVDGVICALDIEKYYDAFYTYLLHGKSANMKSIIRMKKDEIRELLEKSHDEVLACRGNIENINKEIEEIRNSFEKQEENSNFEKVKTEFFRQFHEKTNVERKLEIYFGNARKIWKLTGNKPSKFFWAVKNVVYGPNPISQQFFTHTVNSNHVEKLANYVKKNKLNKENQK